MKTTELKPSQIITLNDYPLYNTRVLDAYIERCRSGGDLPFVPVIDRGIVKLRLGPKLSVVFGDFETQHPDAIYFMLDGSHRTTALTLIRRDIPVVLYETDADIVEARGCVPTGQILLNATLDHTLAENCEILRRHFEWKPYFMTVLEKTERLLKDGFVSSALPFAQRTRAASPGPGRSPARGPGDEQR